MKFKIDFYKTNIGTFFRVNPSGYFYTGKILVNGTNLSSLPKYKGDFYKVDGDIVSVMNLQPQKEIHTHYELINHSLASDKIPLSFSIEDADEHIDDDDELAYSHAFGPIKSLYEKKFQSVPEQLVPVDVEFVSLGELQIDNFTKPEVVTVNVTNTFGFGAKTVQSVDLSAVVKYDDLVQMVVPEFLIHNHPCSLTSEQVYKIIRQHIIENIDGRVAVLSSNYDFCLTVKKVVHTKPFKVKKEILTKRSNSYNPPRFTNQEVNKRQLEIFEMTWAGYKGNGGYGDYTCIPAWKANSFAELVENMRQYLDELMQVINAPTHECNSCNGTGQIFTSLIGK